MKKPSLTSSTTRKTKTLDDENRTESFAQTERERERERERENFYFTKRGTYIRVNSAISFNTNTNNP